MDEASGSGSPVSNHSAVQHAGSAVSWKPATFEDYKCRLQGGDPDLWQLRGEWWHVVHVSEPRPLRERVRHRPDEQLDLEGGRCVGWVPHR